jgi:hypothetical protein
MDAFPFLQYVPAALMPVKKRAMQIHEKERDLYVGHWLNVKKAIQNGTANVSPLTPTYLPMKLITTAMSMC